MSKQRHISRLAAPMSWPVPRKGTKFVTKPVPGAHNENLGMPLVVLIRDVLGIAENKKQLAELIHEKQILVNGKRPRDVGMPVGLFDVIKIPKLGKIYRIVLNKHGRLWPIEIKAGEEDLIILNVINLKQVRDGKYQVTYSNGATQIFDKKPELKINADSVLMKLSEYKILEEIKLKAGALALIIIGKNVGESGVVESIRQTGKIKKETLVSLKTGSGAVLETSQRNLILLSNSKSAKIAVM